MVDQAFILAAGFGTRLRPYTNDKPKPMVTVDDKTLLDHAIDHLKAAGVSKFTINTHYLSDVIHDHMKDREGISISHEKEILDTGGGIKKALKNFNGKDFFITSGDGLWSDGPSGSIIQKMKAAWDPEKMDILILLQPVQSMTTTKGIGDYDIDEEGRAVRSLDKTGTHMFTSIRINKSSVFNNTPDEPFSYLEILDRAEQTSRLYAIINDGQWHHISTPEDLDNVRALYSKESA